MYFFELIEYNCYLGTSETHDYSREKELQTDGPGCLRSFSGRLPEQTRQSWTDTTLDGVGGGMQVWARGTGVLVEKGGWQVFVCWYDFFFI